MRRAGVAFDVIDRRAYLILHQKFRNGLLDPGDIRWEGEIDAMRELDSASRYILCVFTLTRARPRRHRFVGIRIRSLDRELEAIILGALRHGRREHTVLRRNTRTRRLSSTSAFSCLLYTSLRTETPSVGGGSRTTSDATPPPRPPRRSFPVCRSHSALVDPARA